MTPKRPNEPIAPANVPYGKVDPKIPPERKAREDKARDQAATRLPPD
jgi:hypothetical protein